MLRPPQHLVGRARLDDLAVLHHRDVVCQIFDDAEVVSDEEICDAQFILQLPQQIQNLSLHGHIKRGSGFVADDQPRFDRERASDRKPLTLSS